MSDEKEIKDTEEVQDNTENAPATEEAVEKEECCGKDKKSDKGEKCCKGGKKKDRELEAELLKYKEAAEKPKRLSKNPRTNIFAFSPSTIITESAPQRRRKASTPTRTATLSQRYSPSSTTLKERQYARATR